MKKRRNNKNSLNELIKTIAKLKSLDETKKFFRDLCTLSELDSMAERFQIAKKIKEGKTYREISKETGASTATITRIAHWYNHGKGGYKLILG